MRLNYDVLLYIISVADQREVVLSMMQTCRTLHAPSIPKLLSFPILLGHHSKRDKSFLNYILANVSARARHIRDLSLLDDARSLPCSLADFTKILQNCSNLRSLCFSQGIYDLLDEDGLEAHSVIASLTSIRELDIKIAGDLTEALLAEMMTPLESISVSVDRETDWDIDLSQTLTNFSKSLESIETFGLLFLSVSAVYPLVTMFSSEAAEFTSFDTLSRSFPNLRRLHVYYDYETDEEILDDDEPPPRVENRRLQSEDGLGWESLQYLSGDVISLHHLGIVSQVDYLEMWFSFEDAAKFRDIVQDAKPSNVFARHHGTFPGEAAKKDAQIPSLEGFFNIPTLQNAIVDMSSPRLANVWDIWGNIKNNIVSMFDSTPARTLILKIRSRDSRMIRPPVSTEAEAIVQANIKQLAYSISSVAQSLDSIIIDAPHSARVGWSIRRDGDLHELVPNASEDCTRTVQRMYAQFSAAGFGRTIGFGIDD